MFLYGSNLILSRAWSPLLLWWALSYSHVDVPGYGDFFHPLLLRNGVMPVVWYLLSLTDYASKNTNYQTGKLLLASQHSIHACMLIYALLFAHIFTFLFFSLYRCLFASVSSPLISNSPQKTYGLTNNLSYLPFTCTIVKYIRLSLLC